MKRHSTWFIVLLSLLVILLLLGIVLLCIGISTGQSIDLRFLIRDTALRPLSGTYLRF